eukprot:scaffold5096_cov261-Pinguiococcus_pyrenoidosus.AAC.2
MLATTQTRERLEETQRDKETKRERERERERFRIVEKDLDTIRYYHPTSRVARSTRPGRSLFHPLARSPASSLADAQLREHRLMQEVECVSRAEPAEGGHVRLGMRDLPFFP